MTSNGRDSCPQESSAHPHLNPMSFGAPPGCRLLACEEAEDGGRRCRTVIWKAPNGSIGAVVSHLTGDDDDPGRPIVQIDATSSLARLDRRLHWEITQCEFVGFPAAPLLQSAAQALEKVHVQGEA